MSIIRASWTQRIEGAFEAMPSLAAAIEIPA